MESCCGAEAAAGRGCRWTSIPKLQLESPQLRRLLGFVAVTTVANVIIASTWGYSAVNYMDSAQFCGLTCHTVMQPEYTAYVNSPHADVACAECHIGPGASWFVKSKLAGVGQVFAVALNNYSAAHPITRRKPSPGSGNLRALPLARALFGRSV